MSDGAGSAADNPPVVVVISADPRLSHRANEAMRIGLGITAGDNEVCFVLIGPAAHLLDDDTEDLVDGDDIAKFRAAVKELGVPFHVEKMAIPNASDWNTEGHEVIPVTREEIAELVRRGRRFLVF